MLRSNKKISPSSSSASSSPTSSSLPTHYSMPANSYSSQESNGGSPSSIPRRRKSNGKGFSKKKTSWICSSWTLLFVAVTCFGSLAMIRRNETAARHLHKAVRTLADPLPLPPQVVSNKERALTPLLPPRPPQNGLYDVVVLGAGPAGLTAALFATRAGLSVLVFGSDAGSLSETNQLENFPSWQLEGGPLWLQTTKQQAARWGATFAQAGLLVEQLQIENDNTFRLEATGSLQIHARSVVVATGATGRRLGLPLEDALWGKSVHSCAVCDGSSYVNKVVVVVGGGDAAVDGALLLARYAKEVILVHRREELRASNSRNVELLKNTPNIRMEVPCNIVQFETSRTQKRIQNPDGSTKSLEERHLLLAVEVQNANTQTKQRIACDGVFELIGSTPNTDWLKGSGAQLNDEGFLTVLNPSGETRTATSIEGVFAAGEVTDQIYRQAITAAAEGAEAAMDAERWLRNNPAPEQTTQRSSKAIPLQTVLVEAVEAREIVDEPVGPPPPAFEQDDCDLTQQECIVKTVNRYPVVVFSKPWCPFCRKALEALAAEGLSEKDSNLHVIDLSKLGEKATVVQVTLQSMTGRRTVPNVFVGGNSIGGGDETSKFHTEGRLQGMLVNAKAIQRVSNDEKGSCDDLSQEACITQLVNQYPVVVFSKPGCPHCRRALEALAMEGLSNNNPKLRVVDLRSKSNMAEIQDRLEAMTGRRTVPNVFVGGESVGGGSETVQLQSSGDLRVMLTKVRAIE